MGTSGGASPSSHPARREHVACPTGPCSRTSCPPWRLLAHYTAAITGFGLLPAPVAADQPGVRPAGERRQPPPAPGATRTRLTGTRPPADGGLRRPVTAKSGSSHRPVRLLRGRHRERGSYSSGPSARAATRRHRAGHRQRRGPTDDNTVGDALWVSWELGSPRVHHLHVRGVPRTVGSHRHRSGDRSSAGTGHRRSPRGLRHRGRVRGVPAVRGDRAGGHGGAADRTADARRADHVPAAVHRPVPAAGAGAGEQRRRAAVRHGDPGDPGESDSGLPGRGQRGQPVLLDAVPSGSPSTRTRCGRSPRTRPRPPARRRRRSRTTGRSGGSTPTRSGSGTSSPFHRFRRRGRNCRCSPRRTPPAWQASQARYGAQPLPVTSWLQDQTVDAGSGELPLHQLRAAADPRGERPDRRGTLPGRMEPGRGHQRRRRRHPAASGRSATAARRSRSG